MSRDEFDSVLREHLQTNYDGGWVCVCHTARGMSPVGVIFGVLAGPMLLIGDMTWFWWASRRNVVEAVAKFVDTMRARVVTIMYVARKDERFFDYIGRLGLIRRVGILHDVLQEPAVLYQSRRKDL